MRFISWNVNGLRACAGKDGEKVENGIMGFQTAFAEFDADFFCLQETKMQEGQLDLAFPGYQSYWNYAEKKGYSGTAIYTKHTPLSVSYGIGIDEHDHEGRVITLEYENFYLVTVYTPNSQDGLRRLDYRMKWEDDFRAYLKALDAKKPVIVCGDMNVAHEEIVLSLSGSKEEHGMAYRLFRHFRASERQHQDCGYPYQRLWFGSLSGGIGNKIKDNGPSPALRASSPQGAREKVSISNQWGKSWK